MHTGPAFAKRLWFELALIAVVATVGSTGLWLTFRTDIASAAPGVVQSDAPAASWTEVYSSPGAYWRSIQFPTDDVGYAVGGADWYGTGYAKFAKTTDGGQTWTTAQIPGTISGSWLKGLDCRDANTCVVAGRYARVDRTTDGGATWTVGGVLPFNGGKYAGWLHSVALTGQGEGVLAGGTCYDPDTPGTANFLRGTNILSGAAFSVAGIAATNHYYCPVLGDIACPTAGVCYAAPSNTAVIRTTDNGVTWSYVPANYWKPDEWAGIDCTDADTCWVVGKTRGSKKPDGTYIYHGIIGATTDGGNTWNTQLTVYGNTTTSIRFWDVSMVDGQHGYAVGVRARSMIQTIRNTARGQGSCTGLMMAASGA